jgi:hypothetical protein
MIILISLAACGMSEEEQAWNEIYGHLKEDAAKDGVDLDALIASEQADYEQRHNEYLKDRAEAQDFQAKVAPLLDEIETVYAAYKAATASADIVSTAEEFNELYREYMALAEDAPDSVQNLLTKLDHRIRRRADIPECIYRIKAVYADFTDKESFSEAWCYYDLEENNAYIALIADRNIQILKMDGTLCKIDLSSVVTDSTAYISPIGVTDSHFLLYTIDNADYLYFEFPLDGTTATGKKTDRTASAYKQWWFTDIESFIQAEMRVRWV